MILEEETCEKLGHKPSNLSPKSGKRILAKCDKCGIIRETSKNNYRSLCQSCSHMQNHPSEITKEKMRKANKGNTPWNKGGKWSEEIKIKMRENHGDRSGENNSFYGKHHSEATRKVMSEKATKRCESKEERERMSQMRKHRKFPTHHTKPEMVFEEICKKNNLPFHYVGDGGLWIGKKGGKQLNPDFIEANGKKIVVEIFGDYWHSLLLNPRVRESVTLPYRERHYKKYKWTPIFIWETDLKRPDAEAFVVSELKEYIGEDTNIKAIVKGE